MCQKGEQIRASCHVHPEESGVSYQQDKKKAFVDMFRNFKEENLGLCIVSCP